MRSRYSAFVVGDLDYLLRTWHSSTRPAELELEPDVRWYRLDIVSQNRGTLLDTRGSVEFIARFKGPDGAGELHETSEFVRKHGEWLYVDGVVH